MLQQSLLSIKINYFINRYVAYLLLRVLFDELAISVVYSAMSPSTNRPVTVSAGWSIRSRIPVGTGTFHIAATSRLAPGPIPTPVQCVRGAVPSEIKRIP